MVSYLAWFLPLLPWLVNFLLSTSRMRSSMELINRFSKRVLLYAGTIAFRTVILYLGINWLERHLQGSEATLCWYLDLRPKCKER